MGAFAALTHYAKPTRRGRIHVRVSREGWGGPSPPGRVTINIGPLGDAGRAAGDQPGDRLAELGRCGPGLARSFTLPTPNAPYRLEIHVNPTFSPANYGQSDISPARRPGPGQSSVSLDRRPGLDARFTAPLNRIRA